jgi:hypothetical protein
MPKKMPRGQRPGARRTIPARQSPTTSAATTDTAAMGERVATAPATYSRRPQAQPTPARGPIDFATEYHYVGDELKQTGILAGCVFAGLIILSFIIH